MKRQKTFFFCALICIVLLSACFTSWDGSDGNVPLLYTVTLIGSDGKPILIGTTRTAPIVVTVPPGTWDIEVRVDATEDDTFADTRQRFLGTKTINHDKEEKITLDIDINEMTPAIQVKNWGQLSKAFNGEWDRFLNEAGWKPNGKPQYIELLEDTSASNTTAILDGDSNTNIVLWTDKEKVTIKRGNNTGSLFQVKKGTLTLGGSGKGKITIDGEKKSSSNSLITVSGGELIMNEGVMITGNIADGITTASSGSGGGVCVDNGGKFIMNGGTISENASNPYTGLGSDNAGGGGGVYVENAEFIMNGGTISKNTTKGHGGGVRVYKGGIFTMNGGTISENEVIPKNSDSKDNGGGVRVRGTFFMNGGTISNNIAPYGGGVSVADDNQDGTGIGKFIMDGGTISGNIATYGNGGGVHVDLNGTFSKTRGTIYGSNGDSDHPPNTAARGQGQAIYAQSGNTNRSKNTSSGPENILSSSPGGKFSGGWD